MPPPPIVFIRLTDIFIFEIRRVSIFEFDFFLSPECVVQRGAMVLVSCLAVYLYSIRFLIVT